MGYCVWLSKQACVLSTHKPSGGSATTKVGVREDLLVYPSLTKDGKFQEHQQCSM